MCVLVALTASTRLHTQSGRGADFCESQFKLDLPISSENAPETARRPLLRSLARVVHTHTHTPPFWIQFFVGFPYTGVRINQVLDIIFSFNRTETLLDLVK